MFHNFIAGINLVLTICVITHIHDYRNNEIYELRNRLQTAEKQIKDYVDSGAVKKVKISRQIWPNSDGILSFAYTDVWVTPEEANRIKLEELFPK